ncbi:MAG: hypothetical protein QGG36_10220 [Pirellulaceae bacterium]|nr:hypothetical protein [Pirellulaceae bacterium]MDP7016166.1 hypothetical protein [Pirellulaceae bacterium]
MRFLCCLAIATGFVLTTSRAAAQDAASYLQVLNSPQGQALLNQIRQGRTGPMTQQDVNAAMQLARQYGVSDAEIAKRLGGLQSGGLAAGQLGQGAKPQHPALDGLLNGQQLTDAQRARLQRLRSAQAGNTQNALADKKAIAAKKKAASHNTPSTVAKPGGLTAEQVRAIRLRLAKQHAAKRAKQAQAATTHAATARAAAARAKKARAANAHAKNARAKQTRAKKARAVKPAGSR